MAYPTEVALPLKLLKDALREWLVKVIWDDKVADRQSKGAWTRGMGNRRNFSQRLALSRDDKGLSRLNSLNESGKVLL